MSTIDRPKLAPLVAGERMNRAEFHERYEAMPPGTRFELIGGVVHMPSPVGDRHGTVSYLATGWLAHYSLRTPGIKGSSDGSTALDEQAEVQPDIALRILPEYGGQTRKLGNIIGGAPELVIEVSASSLSIDLGPKLADYERTGVVESVVLGLKRDEVFWHVRQGNRLVRRAPDPDGLYRSGVFPGLWLDPVAIMAEDGPTLFEALDRGLASRDYAAFVARLAAARIQP